MLPEEEKVLVQLMQIVETLHENEDKFSDNEKLAEELTETLNMVGDFFKELPGEERNRLLELYKEKLDYLHSKKQSLKRKK